MRTTVLFLISILVIFQITMESVLAMWPGDQNVNMAICTASRGQASPQIISDGSGGAIITWVGLVGGPHIYAQRKEWEL